MSAPLGHSCWQRDLRERLGAHLLLKSLVIPTFFIGFFALYFHLLNRPVFAVTEMPLTSLDRWVGFHPIALGPYVSLWVYVLLPPSLLRGRRELFTYGGAVATLAAMGLTIFWIWPSACPPSEVEWSAHPLFAFLKNVDASGNACPSLHVAFAVLTAIWVERLLRDAGAPPATRFASAAWCAAIIYSTLATRQHVTVDVLAGIALGGAAGLPYPRETRRGFASTYSALNRQTLALVVSLASKCTLFLLGLHVTHPFAAAVLFLAPDIWILAGLLIPNTTLLVPTVTCFQTREREVWLTIDDGPDPATTMPMLDLLHRHGARATFFLIGRKADARPDLVEAIMQRGHSLGNHTETHPLASFWLAGPARTTREIGTWRANSSEAKPTAARWFRPPAGIKTLFLRRALAQQDAVLVGWSARGRENPGPSIAAPLRRLARQIRPGAIVLVHQSPMHGPERVALLAGILEHLTMEGYRCILPERDRLRSSFDADPAPAAELQPEDLVATA